MSRFTDFMNKAFLVLLAVIPTGLGILMLLPCKDNVGCIFLYALGLPAFGVVFIIIGLTLGIVAYFVWPRKQSKESQ